MRGSFFQYMWRVGTWIPPFFFVNELLLGVEASPCANARECGLSESVGFLLVSRRSRAERGTLVLFSPPAGGADGGTSAAVIKGVTGDFYVADNGAVLRLTDGQVWVEAATTAATATTAAAAATGTSADGMPKAHSKGVDSFDFGPLPRALLRGVPISEWTFDKGWRTLKHAD